MNKSTKFTDTQLLCWVEAQGDPGVGWIARKSSTGRGYRVHQSVPAPGLPKPNTTLRGAIRSAMRRGQARFNKAHS